MTGRDWLFTVTGFLAGALLGLVIGYFSFTEEGENNKYARAKNPKYQPGNTSSNFKPGSREDIVYRAHEFFEKKEYHTAINLYEKALMMEGQDANVVTNLGIAYLYTKNPQKALELFERAQKIDPTHWKSLFNTIIVKNQLGAKPEEIRAIHAKLSTIAPKKAAINISLAKISLEKKNFTEAIYYLELQKKLTPYDWNTIGMLAATYKQNKNYDKAIAHYEKLQEILSKHEQNQAHQKDFQQIKEVIAELKKLKASEKEKNEADSSKNQASNTSSNSKTDNREDIVHHAHEAFDNKEYHTAINLYEKALNMQGQDANVVTDLGIAYLYTKNPQKALELFERAQKIDPTHWKSLFNAIIVKNQLKAKPEEIRAIHAKLSTIAPKKAMINVSLANIYFQKNNFAEAIYYLELQRKLTPYDWKMTGMLATAYKQNKNYDKAIAIYEKLLEMLSTHEQDQAHQEHLLQIKQLIAELKKLKASEGEN